MTKDPGMKGAAERINRGHPYNLQKAIQEFERGYLINILQLSEGNKVLACEMLGIRLRTLEKKIGEHGINI